MNGNTAKKLGFQAENTAVKNENYLDPKKWHKQDTTWALSLFGTAIGAGVLFLPINAGTGGLLSLLLITILAFPIMYYSHRALAKMIYASNSAEEGITGTIREYFGNKASIIFNIIYFCSIYTIVLMYSVALTNTASSFMVHQLHMQEPPRAILSLVLVLGLIVILNLGQDITVKVMSMLVYPFIASLLFIAISLIPQWNTSMISFSSISTFSTGTGYFGMLWMTLPVIVFSFNHSPMISSFVMKQRATYGIEATDAKCAQIQKVCYIMTFTVVMFFVWSSVLSLTPNDLIMAKEQNLSILSYLANKLNSPLIAIAAPIIAFVAITKSFLGHYVGAYEVMRDMIIKSCKARGKDVKEKTVKTIILAFVVLTCWYVAYANPSILGLIDTLSGPLVAAILCLLPMFAIYKVPVLAKYRGKISNIFVIIIGVLTVLASIKSLL
ncbi:aromatic amino acid transport family protein [Paenibacillus larvae]|uniref:Serine transporter SdaC n=4 Tax=Paenibacillus larvae TaxID=1464 RepID=V9WCY2_9BACL|nr:aromatic amino acid transport family protein [Paenibacillus larvae]AHD06972.1 serine transporter SdaC [Paenibacillus larvae subsp. larvae DSM 25430]AQR79562.1 septum formation initiator [Paenibacillus larvae subsp. larvae]AVF23239.1 serine transporter SdaC [Paenibacillus larvae subsp. larvae]AVG13532.1 serine transporter SdaC [Paenibacillus larvae subsp. larvae DSM 25430]ETK26081.1 serine transporter SdaC [Paenibacillus larvae subsp. larvae DSM 25719]